MCVELKLCCIILSCRHCESFELYAFNGLDGPPVIIMGPGPVRGPTTRGNIPVSGQSSSSAMTECSSCTVRLFADQSTRRMLPCLFCSSSAPPTSSSVSRDSLLAMLDSRCATMRELRVIHAGLIKACSLSTSTLAVSRLLAFCASPAGDMGYAAMLFARVPRPNLFIWNTMIRGFSQSSAPEKAISLFIEMVTSSEVLPQRLTYPSVFKAYAGLGLANSGAQLHGRIIKLGLEYRNCKVLILSLLCFGTTIVARSKYEASSNE